MLTAAPNDTSALDFEAMARALFREMEAALARSDMTLFNRLARDRHALLMRFCDAEGHSTLSARLLSDLLSENRHWSEELSGHCARLRADIDRSRFRRGTYRSLAGAYSTPPTRVRYVSGRG
jgi:hypothetical protein